MLWKTACVNRAHPTVRHWSLVAQSAHANLVIIELPKKHARMVAQVSHYKPVHTHRLES